jgi:hypothetical protein
MGSKNKLSVRINTVINGEPAEILLELKKRGIILSNTDAVIQGLLALYEKVVQRDLEVARLRSLKAEEEV